MSVHVIKRGLDLPISGAPSTQIAAGNSLSRVVVTANEYPLMKPRMHVDVGDTVKLANVFSKTVRHQGLTLPHWAPGRSSQ